uniref:Protein Star n=1 Tax=Cacopsylla melanoneura TaxID=428564 RepID=A0A8D8YZ02_9HEMI
MRLSCKGRTKCIVNTLVVCLIIFTLVYLKLSSTFYKFIYSFGIVTQTVEGPAASQHVLDTLKTYHLHPPSARSYNIAHPIEYDPSQGQSRIVRDIFANKRDGTFVECGAVDGVFLSNSLYLERALNWRGLLIEADRTNFGHLRTKNRKAFSSNTCLSTSDQATVNLFNSVNQTSEQHWWVKGIGKLDDVGDGGLISKGTKTKVQCFPFYSFMLALDMNTVDYFSLDVEGAELNILRTIPFDKIEIKVMSVEWLHDTQKESELHEFLESKGYHEYHSKKMKMNQYEKIFIKNGVELNYL